MQVVRPQNGSKVDDRPQWEKDDAKDMIVAEEVPEAIPAVPSVNAQEAAKLVGEILTNPHIDYWVEGAWLCATWRGQKRDGSFVRHTVEIRFAELNRKQVKLIK